jgi:hypothetical protein
MTQKTRLHIAFLMVVVMAFAIVTISSAAGPDGSGWWTNYTVQNATSGDANVVVTAYHASGGADTQYTGSLVLGAGNSATYHPGLDATCESSGVATNGCRLGVNPALPAGFEGSVVVSSDAPVVSFVSVKNNQSGTVGVSDGTARASYNGVSGLANTLYFPSFKNNYRGQSTIHYVQAGGSDATVQMLYTTTAGATYDESVTIEANRSYAFVPATAGIPSCDGGGSDTCRGGAILTVTSGADVAGTTVEYADGVSVAEFVLSSGAITPANTDYTILIPSAKNNFNGQTTGIAILNTSNTDAIVDLDFSVKGVKNCTSVSVGDTDTVTDITVPAQGTQVIRGTLGNTPYPSDCDVFYSVVIKDQGADQLLAATVNQSETVNGQSYKTKYNGFAASSATNTVLFPLVKEYHNGTGITALSLINAGSIATTVEVTYQGASSYVMQTVSIEPGSSITLRDVANGDSDIASGTLPLTGTKYGVTAVANEPGATIVGFAQEAHVNKTLDIQNYSGINQ